MNQHRTLCPSHWLDVCCIFLESSTAIGTDTSSCVVKWKWSAEIQGVGQNHDVTKYEFSELIKSRGIGCPGLAMPVSAGYLQSMR